MQGPAFDPFGAQSQQTTLFSPEFAPRAPVRPPQQQQQQQQQQQYSAQPQQYTPPPPQQRTLDPNPRRRSQSFDANTVFPVCELYYLFPAIDFLFLINSREYIIYNRILVTK